MYQVVQGVPWHVTSRYKEYRVRYVRALHRGVAESVDAADLNSAEEKSRASSSLAIPTIISIVFGAPVF